MPDLEIRNCTIHGDPPRAIALSDLIADHILHGRVLIEHCDIDVAAERIVVAGRSLSKADQAKSRRLAERHADPKWQADQARVAGMVDER
jgi:hypothetical protein